MQELTKIQKEIVESLLKAEDDIEQGRTIPAEQVFKEWKEKYRI